jgi:dihydrolipoamide dehydrogenase
VISAVGVQGNIENLGLEALGVKTERGCIVIDGYGKTNVPGIYAIGDVAGPPMLAHKAEHEGVICVEAIKGMNPHAMDKLADPGLHLLQPAGGLGRPDRSQGQGSRQGHPRRPLPLRRQWQGDRAQGEDQGMVKVIFDKKTGQLLGAHMVGAEVRTDPGLCRRDEPGDHRRRTLAHHLPASDHLGDDEGSVLDAYGRALNA